jgi:diphosphomevalonate decarboxylase
MKHARATAHSNIALVKYWGKRTDSAAELNLPAVGSLSMTLDELRSVTTIGPAAEDGFTLDGSAQGPRTSMGSKVFAHLDRVWAARHEDAPRPPCQVVSVNHLPTAAGLASSASGFCALTVAANAALELALDPTEVSGLSRQGSGSAARSVWGGFVRLDAGERSDGTDCVARPLLDAEHWDLRLLIVHARRGPKAVGSTEGMERSRLTSPYYAPWVDSSSADLDGAQRALEERDLPALGRIMEHSCFKMHACMMASDPPLVYWRGTTLEIMHELWAARADGLEGYATSDAGPHVKVLCRAETAVALGQRLRAVAGVTDLQIVAPGPAASVELLEEGLGA